MKYLLILSCLLFTSVGWSQEYGEQQKFMTDLIGETITKNKSAVNSASKTRNWIKASNKLCEIGGIFDAYGHKKDWYGRVQKIFMDDDGDLNIKIDIGNNNSVLGFDIKESLIDTVLDIPTDAMVIFSGYFVKGNMSENECLDGGLTASPDMLNESFLFNFTCVALLKNDKRNCIDDKPERELLEYYENGQLAVKRNYKDGKKYGKVNFHYYKNGQLKSKENYKDGKRNGETLLYYESGQLREKINFKDGKRQGEWKMYYESGELEAKNNYIDDKKDGKFIYYYKNGQLALKGHYKEDKFDGKLLWYHENGKLEKTYIYKDGKLEGEYLDYYENGQLKYKRNYKDDKMEGEQLTYWENGQLGIKGNYKDGIKDGERVQYFENGQVEKTEIYKDGTLIETIEH